MNLDSKLEKNNRTIRIYIRFTIRAPDEWVFSNTDMMWCVRTAWYHMTDGSRDPRTQYQHSFDSGLHGTIMSLHASKTLVNETDPSKTKIFVSILIFRLEKSHVNRLCRIMYFLITGNYMLCDLSYPQTFITFINDPLRKWLQCISAQIMNHWL